MRVTVTELKKMIAESVAKHMKEEAPADRIHAAAASAPDSRGAVLASRRSGGAMPPAPVSSAPAPARSTTTTVQELRSMVREVIEEMMAHKEEELDEVEKLKEAVRKMVRAELKRSGK